MPRAGRFRLLELIGSMLAHFLTVDCLPFKTTITLRTLAPPVALLLIRTSVAE
jgi:hypothetical protein